ncbi:unnamed protein product [Arctogadus glacialis]
MRSSALRRSERGHQALRTRPGLSELGVWCSAQGQVLAVWNAGSHLGSDSLRAADEVGIVVQAPRTLYPRTLNPHPAPPPFPSTSTLPLCPPPPPPPCPSTSTLPLHLHPVPPPFPSTSTLHPHPAPPAPPCPSTLPLHPSPPPPPSPSTPTLPLHSDPPPSPSTSTLPLHLHPAPPAGADNTPVVVFLHPPLSRLPPAIYGASTPCSVIPFLSPCVSIDLCSASVLLSAVRELPVISRALAGYVKTVLPW